MDNLQKNTILNPEQVANRAALGIYTKSQSALTTLRLARFALQSQAAKLLPHERVKSCLRCRIDSNISVGVKYNTKRQQAHYSNLQRCGSVWHCPVCASIITEKRRAEIKKAIDAHDGGLYMLTLTFPHYLGDNLKALLSRLELALSRFFGARKAKAIFGQMGKIGHIKALEVTHGRNGWHPHFHLLIFTKQELPLDYDTAPLLEQWQNACRLAKLPIPNSKYGLNWKKGDYSGYISKWGIDNEIAKGHLKTGKNGNLTAWDLLKMSMLDDEQAGKLFQEFAISFKGRRQLVWSRGLKAMFSIDNKTDEELAEETEKTSVDFDTVENQLFDLLRRYECRAYFLELCEKDYLDGGQRRYLLLENLAKLEYERLLSAA